MKNWPVVIVALVSGASVAFYDRLPEFGQGDVLIAPVSAVEVGPPPDQGSILPLCCAECQCSPTCECSKMDCLAVADQGADSRELTSAEVVAVMQDHIDELTVWMESRCFPDDYTMRQYVDGWLKKNPQHDPRLPQATPAATGTVATPPAPTTPPAQAASYTPSEPMDYLPWYDVRTGAYLGHKWTPRSTPRIQFRPQPVQSAPQYVPQRRQRAMRCVGGRCG